MSNAFVFLRESTLYVSRMGIDFHIYGVDLSTHWSKSCRHAAFVSGPDAVVLWRSGKGVVYDFSVTTTGWHADYTVILRSLRGVARIRWRFIQMALCIKNNMYSYCLRVIHYLCCTLEDVDKTHKIHGIIQGKFCTVSAMMRWYFL